MSGSPLPIRRVSRKLLATFAVLAVIAALLPWLGAFSAHAAAPAVSTATPVAVGTNCNGIVPTPGSENTQKRLIGGDLQPGGTAIFEITYPLDASDVGKTFTVQDCPIIGGDVHNAQAYEFSFVPNNTVFDVAFTLKIPSTAALGTTYCNYAKTTGPPSSAQGSNRKAGPACFTIGGNLQIEKHETGSAALLPGATFSVSCPTAAPTTPISAPPVVVSGLVSGGSPVVAAYNAGAWQAAGVADPGRIGISGPSGTSCTVTETAAPAGHILPATTSHTYTIPVGTATQVVDWYNDAAAPHLHIVKSADPADGSTVTAGSTITYSLAYYNDGNVDVANASVTDTVPPNTTLVAGSISGTGSIAGSTITWSGLTVQHGTTAASPAGTVSFQVKVDGGTAAGTTIDNTGHLAATGLTTVDSNTTHHHVQLITTLKSSSPPSGTAATPAGVRPGDRITYTVTVTNPGAAAVPVDITDAAPANTTYVSGTASPAPTSVVGNTLTWTGLSAPANGGSVSVSFDVTVDGGTPSGTDIQNTASVNGSDTNTTYHQVQLPDFSASKSAVPAAGTSAATATEVAPGDSIDYTIHVENNGLAAGSTPVTDTIPAGTTYTSGTIDNGGVVAAGVASWNVTLNAGASADLHFSVTVDAGDANGTVIRNVATVAGSSTNATYHVVKFPHFTFSKSAVPAGGASAGTAASVGRGDTITYTIHVINDGEKFGAVQVVDGVPANTTYTAGSANSGGVFDVGTNTLTWDVVLAAGDSADLSFAVTVNAGAADGASIANSATINGAASNTVYHRVVVPPPPPVISPLLHLAKVSSPASGAIVQRGDRIDYTVTVTNTGNGAATGQTVTDTLPAGVTLVAGSATPAPASIAGQVLTWTVDVPAQSGATPGSVTLAYAVTVDKAAAAGATLANAVSVAGLTAATEHHVATGDLTLVKHVAETSAEYGDTLHYSFTAAATGAATQMNVTVADVLPEGTTYVDGSAGCTDAGPCTATYDDATRTVTWALGDLAAGASRALALQVTIDTPDYDPAVGLPAKVVHNVGTIAADGFDSAPSNEVKTPLVAVLGVKVVRKPPKDDKPAVEPTSHSRLPFTGSSLPVWPATAIALMLITAGTGLTATRRRRPGAHS